MTGLINILRFHPQNRTEISRMLELIEGIAHEVSALSPGVTVPPGSGPDPAIVRNIFLGLVDETLELMHEFDWKPWKQKDTLDKANIADEFADVIVFLGMLMTVMSSVGITADVLAEAYLAKVKLVRERLTGKVEDYTVRQVGPTALPL